MQAISENRNHAAQPLEDEAPSVHLRAARLSYRGETIFDDLDLHLPARRTTCLLGPSGVGKTSLLRMVAGLTHAAQGEAVDAEGSGLEGRIAYMAQQDLLLPWLTVAANVTLGSRLRGEPAPRAEAKRLLERVGLGDAASFRPDALSGGMRQRAALARTLIERRPVVLMDEPFSALDAITRLELQSLAAELLRGRTVLLITHDPLEALRLGHRVLVMSGRPARLQEAIEPPGEPPRDPAGADILRLQGDLLAQLSKAKP